ncbi:hypothetical protein ASG92_23945 [Arthrobacter sp. Soil736]|uniref:Zn-ribbon domain-containing OB-fold protein n=1 Tax=Arthrobacter sp. Soil736 TaxID=1736395 RepID=UPI0006F69981|nr:OB-fold domain-containing protein [Arthrobacter sp. Soil736]KRE56020.1 hypothetical protein ASG92_23945 [Arthrobacter sp. Soil736]
MAIFPIVSDPATAEFLSAAERGVFLIVRDRHTGEFHDPTTDVTLDPENLEYVEASGAGTVVSWSIAHGRNADGTPKETAIGIVQLAEGPWWRCELLGAEPGENLTGRSVYADFIKTGPDATHSTEPSRESCRLFVGGVVG